MAPEHRMIRLLIRAEPGIPVQFKYQISWFIVKCGSIPCSDFKYKGLNQILKLLDSCPFLLFVAMIPLAIIILLQI